MAPNTAQEWLAVASERAADAEAMLSSGQDSVGPVYMVGYAIECTLKAYLQSRNKPFPRCGSAGHDLKRLWLRGGFTFRDLRDSTGQTFVIESSNTALLYYMLQPLSVKVPALLYFSPFSQFSYSEGQASVHALTEGDSAQMPTPSTFAHALTNPPGSQSDVIRWTEALR